jgi:hypothetical protein
MTTITLLTTKIMLYENSFCRAGATRAAQVSDGAAASILTFVVSWLVSLHKILLFYFRDYLGLLQAKPPCKNTTSSHVSSPHFFVWSQHEKHCPKVIDVHPAKLERWMTLCQSSYRWTRLKFDIWKTLQWKSPVFSDNKSQRHWFLKGHCYVQKKT